MVKNVISLFLLMKL